MLVLLVNVLSSEIIATGRDTSCIASEIHRSNNGYLSLATTINHIGLVTAVGLTGVRRVNETRSSNSHCDFCDVIAFTNRLLVTSSTYGHIRIIVCRNVNTITCTRLVRFYNSWFKPVWQ